MPTRGNVTRGAECRGEQGPFAVFVHSGCHGLAGRSRERWQLHALLLQGQDGLQLFSAGGQQALALGHTLILREQLRPDFDRPMGIARERDLVDVDAIRASVAGRNAVDDIRRVKRVVRMPTQDCRDLGVSQRWHDVDVAGVIVIEAHVGQDDDAVDHRRQRGNGAQE